MERHLRCGEFRGGGELVGRLMLALLAVTMVGLDATQQGKDETQAMLKPEAADDQGPTAPARFDLHLLPVGLGIPSAPSVAVAPRPGQDDDALDDPRPPAVATGPGQTGAPDGAAVERRVPITFYSCLGPRGGFCGRMSSGNVVYEGAAACGPAYALGDRVSIAGDQTGRVYVCEDRGWLAPTQVDVFWYREEDGRAWTTQVGRWAEVRREPDPHH